LFSCQTLDVEPEKDDDVIFDPDHPTETDTGIKIDNPVSTFDLSYLNQMSVNTTNAKEIWDVIHTTATLQGVVNRDKPRLYLFYVENGGYNIDRYWWDKYRKSGKWISTAKATEYKDIATLVTSFKNDIQGAVVYDPQVYATSNVASSVAGIENLIAVRYDNSPNSLYQKLIVQGPKIPVKVWLVGENGEKLFTGSGTIPGTGRASTGSSKGDAYAWFIEHYLKTGKCNTRYAGHYIDQFWMTNPTAERTNHHTLTNHDFFVSKKGFFFDLSPWADETPIDDSQQPIGSDVKILKEMLLLAYQQNNNGNIFTHIGGHPPFQFKYSSLSGGSHIPVHTEGELGLIIASYNGFLDADASSHGALANSSFWQHFPLKTSYPQKWITKDELIVKGYLDKNGKLQLGNKQLLVFYVGDYDASAWLSQTTPTLWDNPARGKVPMMWAISPVLQERVPQALDYRRESATANDYFVASNNGAGHLLPGMLQAPRTLSGLPDGTIQWANHCKPYYEKWGLTVTGFVIDGTAPGLNQKGLDAYASFSPNGIVPQNAPLASLHGNMPVLSAVWDVDQGNPIEAAADAVRRIHERNNIPFHWFRNILKSPEWYVQVVAEMKRLDPNIVVVDAPTYFELLRIYLKEN
jgi:hypothetical protein